MAATGVLTCVERVAANGRSYEDGIGAAEMDNRLRELRAARGWSQARLAEELEVSRQTVNAIETGKYDPSLPLAFKLARVFGLPIESIFSGGSS